MKIHLIYAKATPQEINEMLEELGAYIKVAVDIERGLLAGGGELHADAEEVLLANDSQQKNIWGADWDPQTGAVKCEAMLNIRPRDGNYSMLIKDPQICGRVIEITQRLLGGRHG